MPQVTVNLAPRASKDSDTPVDDGESFVTVAKDKQSGMYHLYNPDRDRKEQVILPDKRIQSLDSSTVKENHEFKIWGDKQAWSKTPSRAFDF
jgi:hypothetical protein